MTAQAVAFLIGLDLALSVAWLVAWWIERIGA